jgi:hypothetical protein
LHHGSDYQKFHKDVVPRSGLPSDFGGDLATIEELHNQHNKKFEKLRNYFVNDEKEARLL